MVKKELIKSSLHLIDSWLDYQVYIKEIPGLAVGIAIDPMTQENGCLLVLPGTHRGRIFDHHQDGHFAGAVTEPGFSPDGAVPLEVGAGGISLHHARVLHGSVPNTSPDPRRLLLFQYCALDAGAAGHGLERIQ